MEVRGGVWRKVVACLDELPSKIVEDSVYSEAVYFELEDRSRRRGMEAES